MSNAYGCDGISTATAERELGLDGGVDENTLQAAIEEQAEDEVRECARPFRDWLNDCPEHAISIAVAVCGWPVGKHLDGTWWSIQECRAQNYVNVSEARAAVERDYIAYRTSTMPEWERDEIAASIRADREAA